VSSDATTESRPAIHGNPENEIASFHGCKTQKLAISKLPRPEKSNPDQSLTASSRATTYQTEQMSKKSVRAVLFSSLCGISLQLIETFARSAAGDLWCCDSCRLLAAKKEVYQIAFSQGRPNMGSWQHAILPGRGVSEFQRTFDSIH
jgi:hypothetical protein